MGQIRVNVDHVILQLLFSLSFRFSFCLEIRIHFGKEVEHSWSMQFTMLPSSNDFENALANLMPEGTLAFLNWRAYHGAPMKPQGPRNQLMCRLLRALTPYLADALSLLFGPFVLCQAHHGRNKNQCGKREYHESESGRRSLHISKSAFISVQ